MVPRRGAARARRINSLSCPTVAERAVGSSPMRQIKGCALRDVYPSVEMLARVQSLELLTVDQEVGGSSPPSCTR
jgi:hypothetical protein